MSLYNLNKDELIKIICTISADKDKEIAKLKSKYENVIDKISYVDHVIDMRQCEFCDTYEFKEYSDIWGNIVFTCPYCYQFYHKACIKKCKFCKYCINCCKCNQCDSCSKETEKRCYICAICEDCGQLKTHPITNIYYCNDCFEN